MSKSYDNLGHWISTAIIPNQSMKAFELRENSLIDQYWNSLGTSIQGV